MQTFSSVGLWSVLTTLTCLCAVQQVCVQPAVL